MKPWLLIGSFLFGVPTMFAGMMAHFIFDGPLPAATAALGAAMIVWPLLQVRRDMDRRTGDPS